MLMNERQNQQKRHHQHVDFHSNDSQVSTRIIRATACIWKRVLAESNTWNDSTLRLLPTLANGPLVIQTFITTSGLSHRIFSFKPANGPLVIQTLFEDLPNRPLF